MKLFHWSNFVKKKFTFQTQDLSLFTSKGIHSEGYKCTCSLTTAIFSMRKFKSFLRANTESSNKSSVALITGETTIHKDNITPAKNSSYKNYKRQSKQLKISVFSLTYCFRRNLNPKQTHHRHDNGVQYCDTSHAHIPVDPVSVVVFPLI